MKHEVRWIPPEFVDATGFSGAEYDQVIVFRDPKKFFETLDANPQMEAIIGADSGTKANFPNVYIAGVRANLHEERTAARRSAIQK